jgi:hypothetical protein
VNPSRLSALVAVVLAACGGDDGSGPPLALEISDRTPAANATTVETGAIVTVTFNQAIDPATLTAATLKVTTGGVELPAAISYVAATHTARAAVPLLPDAAYEVEITTGVRTAANASLSAPAMWTFATRAWQGATLDTAGQVGLWSSIALEGSGRLHISYNDGSNAALMYATCVANCTAAASWDTVTADGVSVGGRWTSLKVDATGGIHVSYAAFFGLNYATCTTNCTTAANWQHVIVDSTASVGNYSSLAMGGSGSLHVAYFDETNGNLKYATCASNCVLAASWSTTTVDNTGDVGYYASLALSAGGRLHVTYWDLTNGDLRYATCTMSCATGANWQAVTVDDGGSVGSATSLAVDASGGVHVSYSDNTNSNLRYATCPGNCTTTVAWQAATVDSVGEVASSTALVVDGTGRVHIAYRDDTNSNLKYATCAAGCAAGAGWRALTVDDDGDVGSFPSLVIGASGRLHIAYWDVSSDNLKYIE